MRYAEEEGKFKIKKTDKNQFDEVLYQIEKSVQYRNELFNIERTSIYNPPGKYCIIGIETQYTDQMNEEEKAMLTSFICS